MTVNLDTRDYQNLFNILKKLPDMATVEGRQMLLAFSGFKNQIPMFNLSGSGMVAANEIITRLSALGRLTYEEEALGRFLNALKENMIVVDKVEQKILDELLVKYNMMMPIVSSPKIDDWRGSETSENILEKIIGENTLRPIAFLEQGLTIAKSVAFIKVTSKNGTGTGFMIAPDLLITCNHVVPQADLLSTTLFRFNYEENFKGEAKSPSEYRAKPEGIFYTNEDLDYTVIQLKDIANHNWAWLPLKPQHVRKGERANIIQHPAGRAKEISLQNNFIEYTGKNIVQYVTSTQPGSSGSPVLNDNWEVIAVHHSGGNITEPTIKRRYFRNEGTLVNKILADLPREILAMVETTTNI